MRQDDAVSIAIISRYQASIAGLSKYFTGRPCKRGHLYYRNTKNATCLRCASERIRYLHALDPDARRLDAKKRYAENPEFAQRARERSRTWHETNKERARERAKRYQKENFEKLSAQWKAWREANKERKKARDEAWHKAHPEASRAQTAKRRARLKAALGRYTAKDIQTRFKLQRGRCGYCRTKLSKGYHADHIMPLVLGGANEPRNIQLLCPPCNIKKNAQHPIDFAQQRGLLL